MGVHIVLNLTNVLYKFSSCRVVNTVCFEWSKFCAKRIKRVIRDFKAYLFKEQH